MVTVNLFRNGICILSGYIAFGKDCFPRLPRPSLRMLGGWEEEGGGLEATSNG